MATLSQINASRINGARSKGPVTTEGKARVAQNGAKHGIYSQLVVLHNEDHSLYLASREAHLAEWSPATETEHNLVIDIVDARWRLRRFSTLETAAIDFEVERTRAEISEAFTEIDEGTRTVLAFNALLISNRTFEVLQTATRAQHRIIERATSQLIRLSKFRHGTSPSPAPQPAPTPAAPENQGTKPEPTPIRTQQTPLTRQTETKGNAQRTPEANHPIPENQQNES